ncbi:FRG domain-containing protein [Methylophaga muralis]|uniref:FRG domain protein n=1 Tax=Methylophaga muralis TaxID=291169 RepID=A0A1E3GSW4_9GAMM|nr:FRG domain-containing protein [Methylophaga muralis]ODN67162.1 FRG domain protein [Methylophaga muralis]
MSEEPNWEKVPVWNSQNPEESFDILSDEFSGRIPVTRIESWQSFVELLESPFFDARVTEWVFRGHRRFDWNMTPTLGRLTKNAIITRELSEQQLKLFRKAIRGRTADHSLLEDGVDDNDDELWSIGQHHGLMTPLLDWTHSPYVALFFAFAKEDSPDEKDNPYRAVYALNKTFVANDEVCPEIRVIEPRKDDHGRLVSQAGLFTFSPYDSTIENKLSEVLLSDEFPIDSLKDADEAQQPAILARYLCKIYIKNDGQKECLRHLRRMNVHHASLFPDLIGAADYCNALMTDQHYKEESRPEPSHPPQVFTDDIKKAPQIQEPTEETHRSVTDLLVTFNVNNALSPESLRELSKEISRVLASRKLVDWMDRESLQSEIKTKTRALLRRHSYPEENRDSVIARILDVGNGAGDS